MAVGEVRAEGRDRLGAGADVVVDDVEDDGEPLAVCGVDEAREPVRSTVGRMRREVVEPVVAPVAVAREGRDRHDLDRRDPELAQRSQPRDDSVERALGRERPDVQLVDRELVQCRLRSRRDVECARVEDAGRASHALGLPARARIRPSLAVDDDEVVVTVGRGHVPGPGPVVLARELVVVGRRAGPRASPRVAPTRGTRPASTHQGSHPVSAPARGYPSDRIRTLVE